MSTTTLFPIAVSSQLDETGVERVHAARTEASTTRGVYIPTVYLWTAESNRMDVRRSSDYGTDGFYTYIDTALTTPSSERNVYSVGGRLFHLGYAEGATSSTGSSWQALAGLVGHNYSGVVRTTTEWLIFGASDGLNVSTDAVNFTQRAAPVMKYPTISETTVLAIDYSNNICLSTDSGTNFITYASGFTSLYSMFRLSDRWVIFGKNASNILEVKTSLTGLSGSWATVTSPTATNSQVFSLAQSTSGRILIVVGSGVDVSKCYYTDDMFSTWNLGASFSPYTFYSAQTAPLNFVDGYFFCSMFEGSGLTQIFRSSTGTGSWGVPVASITTSGNILSVPVKGP